MNMSAIRSIVSLPWHPYPSYWRRYFAYGYRTQWKSVRVTDWREAPDSCDLVCQCIAETVEGEMFYTAAHVTGLQIATAIGQSGLAGYMGVKLKYAHDSLNRFLDPNCGCKLGWHRKCRVHGTWQR